MLRRKPTAITLTSEDIAAYEDHRLASLNQKENKGDNGAYGDSGAYGGNGAGAFGTPKKSDSAKIDPNDELKPLPGDRARVRGGAGVGGGMSREERIVGR